MIAIVNYGLNNLASVRNALHAAGCEPLVTNAAADIEAAHGLILPGIGAAAAGMERLRALDLIDPLRQAAAGGRPLLGICLGMQLLFEWSEEGDAPCLGILPGRVERLRGPKTPQIGWNQVQVRSEAPMWTGLPSLPYLYFVHSYVCRPDERADIAGETEYGGLFCSAVTRGLVWGTQFHPERSGRVGLALLANFVRACGDSTG